MTTSSTVLGFWEAEHDTGYPVFYRTFSDQSRRGGFVRSCLLFQSTSHCVSPCSYFLIQAVDATTLTAILTVRTILGLVLPDLRDSSLRILARPIRRSILLYVVLAALTVLRVAALGGFRGAPRISEIALCKIPLICSTFWATAFSAIASTGAL